MKLNLGAGKVPKPRSEGWVNLDKFVYPTTDEVEYRQIDLFRYPWDIPDNSVDAVYASHIVEHVPHEPKPSASVIVSPSWDRGYDIPDNETLTRWYELQNLDGFFCFFAEVWRICKPDAMVECICPFGYTRGAFQDPTHTRYIVPATFHYLTSEDNANWDYHLPLRFKTVSAEITIEPNVWEKLKDDETALDWAIGHQWDIARDLRMRLQVMK